MKKFLLFAFAALLFAACNNETPESKIEISPETISVPAAGGTFTAQLKSTDAWTAKSNQSWVTVSPESGDGDAMITINIDPSDLGEESKARVTFANSEKKSATLEVTRDALAGRLLRVSPMGGIYAPVGGYTTELQVKSNGKWNVVIPATWASVSPTSGENDGVVTLTVEATSEKCYDRKKTTLIFTQKDVTGYELKVEIPVTREKQYLEGLLPGEFYISENKKIQFSSGNLQYQASTKTWRFAEHQFDYIGERNSNISATYDGWIDLFGWGTGSNPTLTSKNDADYATFTDWGINKISNGGNDANMWRTLTIEEWDYLIKNNMLEKAARTGVDGNHGTIVTKSGQEIHGAFIVPSTWPYDVCSGPTNTWDYNVFTEEEWEKYEKAGAVFFPASGRRTDASSVDEIGDEGRYWTSSKEIPEGSSYTRWRYINCAVGYHDLNHYGTQSSHPYFGFSVRLVRDVNED